MKVYTPNQYAEKVLGGAVTGRTVLNWCKDNKLAGHLNVSRVMSTPTGQYLIYVSPQSRTMVDDLVIAMKRRL